MTEKVICSQHHREGLKRHLPGRTIQHGSTTPLGVPGADWGGDPPPSPTGNEREREGLMTIKVASWMELRGCMLTPILGKVVPKALP